MVENPSVSTLGAPSAPPAPAASGDSATPPASTPVVLTEERLTQLLKEATTTAVQRERTAAGRRAAEDRRASQEQMERAHEERIKQRLPDLDETTRTDVQALLGSREEARATQSYVSWQNQVLKEAGLTPEDYEPDGSASPPDWTLGLVKATQRKATSSLQSLVEAAVERRLADATKTVREEAGLETVDTRKPGGSATGMTYQAFRSLPRGERDRLRREEPETVDRITAAR